MTSDELNTKLSDLADREELYNIEETGKAIPYIGWFWRDVNFDADQYWLGRTSDIGLVGFMQKNKWGYPEIKISVDESKEIRAKLEAIAEASDDEKLMMLLEQFHQHMQSFSPRFKVTHSDNEFLEYLGMSE